MSVDRLVLITVAIVTTMTIFSFHYHFAIANYGRFVYEQVLPASGVLARLPELSKNGEEFDLDEHLATYGTPYLPVNSGKKVRRFSPVGSDYLGIWHYSRELLRGHNPYENSKRVIYISASKDLKDIDVPIIYDASVPEQFLGSLSYFPMGIIIPLIFYLPNYFASLALYSFVFITFIICMCACLVRRCPGQRVPVAILAVAMFLTSFPIAFLIERGNIEGISFMLLVLGLYSYIKGHDFSAAVLLALAASAKVAPAVFFALFLLDKKYKALALAMAVLIGSNIVAMLFMHSDLGTIFRQLLSHLGDFSQQIASNEVVTRFNHSLLNLIRGSIHPFVSKPSLAAIMGRLMPYYASLTMIAAVSCLMGLRGRPFVNRVVVLTAILLLFPTISYDYKLIYLYIAFGLIWLDFVGKRPPTRYQVIAIVLLAVTFSPKSYRFKDYSIDFVVNGLCLIALLVLGLTTSLGHSDAIVPIRNPRSAGYPGTAPT